MKPSPPEPSGGELVYIRSVNVDEASVSLRFFGDDLDPDTVTSLLGCEPTISYAKGGIIPDPRYHRIAKTGSWRLESDWSDEKTLEELINAILGKLTDDLDVWGGLTARLDADLFCGLSIRDTNRVCELSAEVIERISERRIKLRLNIYYDGDDDA